MITKNLSDIGNVVVETTQLLHQLNALIHAYESSEPESSTIKESKQLLYHKLQNLLNSEKNNYQKLKSQFHIKVINFEASQGAQGSGEGVNTQGLDEKQNHINEIYEKTLLVSKISSDINTLANEQEKKLQSIESHIDRAETHLIGSQVALKEKASLESYTSTKTYLVLLIIIIAIFILVFYSTLI